MRDSKLTILNRLYSSTVYACKQMLSILLAHCNNTNWYKIYKYVCCRDEQQAGCSETKPPLTHCVFCKPPRPQLPKQQMLAELMNAKLKTI